MSYSKIKRGIKISTQKSKCTVYPSLNFNNIKLSIKMTQIILIACVAEWIKLLDVEQVGMGSNPTSGGLISKLSNWEFLSWLLLATHALCSLHDSPNGLWAISIIGFDCTKCYRSLNCKL